MSRVLLALAAGLLSHTGALAAEPLKVDRKIAKEPVYATKTPRYGLMLFGPEGKDRVWFVHDGDTLYVDRNGNGDLTEAGKNPPRTLVAPHGFVGGVAFSPDGKTLAFGTSGAVRLFDLTK